MKDLFAGTWTLNHARSEFDPNHQPSAGTMVWERDPKGYHMQAEGITREGKVVKEQPQHFILDGQPRPVPGVPDVMMVSSRPDSHTVLARGTRSGVILGEAIYVVAPDGRSLTASASGRDAAGRPFKTKVVFDRTSA